VYDALPEHVRQMADRAFTQFQVDPFHPSLCFKEVNKRRGIWSARINDDYRVLGFREIGEMTWFWIGSHTAYDAMLSRLR
jgi:hypothetical protein